MSHVSHRKPPGANPSAVRSRCLAKRRARLLRSGRSRKNKRPCSTFFSPFKLEQSRQKFQRRTATRPKETIHSQTPRCRPLSLPSPPSSLPPPSLPLKPNGSGALPRAHQAPVLRAVLLVRLRVLSDDGGGAAGSAVFCGEREGEGSLGGWKGGRLREFFGDGAWLRLSLPPDMAAASVLDRDPAPPPPDLHQPPPPPRALPAPPSSLPRSEQTFCSCSANSAREPPPRPVFFWYYCRLSALFLGGFFPASLVTLFSLARCCFAPFFFCFLLFQPFLFFLQLF